jgi:predicted transcriptional regulator
MELTKTEEQLMNYLWMLEKAFMKDLIEAFPEPKPATTTVATLLKRMTDKGFVGFRTYGSIREYYPLVGKPEYFAKHLKGLIQQFFNNSPAQFASFFTSETNLTDEELEELKKIVDQQIQKKKK